MLPTKRQITFEDRTKQAEREIFDAFEAYFGALSERVAEHRERLWERYQARDELVSRIETDEARQNEITARMSAMESEINRARLASDYLKESDLQGEFAQLSEELSTLKQRLRVARENLNHNFSGVPTTYEDFETYSAKSTVYGSLKKADALKRRIDRQFPAWRRRVRDANR